MNVPLGYFLTRLVPYGPQVPCRIWMAGERDENGELISDAMLCAEINGRPAPVHDCYVRHRVWVNDETRSELLDCPGCVDCATEPDAMVTLTMAEGWRPGYVLRRGVFPKCTRNPISESEYRYLVDDSNWVNQFEPTDPKATPYLRVGHARQTAEARRKIYEKVK